MLANYLPILIFLGVSTGLAATSTALYLPHSIALDVAGNLYIGAVNAFTGTGLFMADASTRGINPDFYIKLVFVFAGVVLVSRIRKTVFANPQLDKGPMPSGAKTLAVASLFCWFAAIICGRLIAYVVRTRVR